MKKLLFLLCLCCLMLSACSVNPSASPASQPTELTFMAGYKPQANLPFVGVYVAQEKGFFTDENLAVTIEHSTGQGVHLQLLAAGKIQVTTQDAAVLLKRRADPGLPLVSFALIGQHSQQAFAALQSSGFISPKDWEGHTVGYKGTVPPDLYAILNAAGADIDQIELVNVGYDPRLLTEGKVDVYPVFKSNEPFQINSWGYAIDLWDAEDFGLPGLGLTYVTSDDYLQANPEALAHFLKAALKGIEYARQNPEEALDIVMKYAGEEADRDTQAFMLTTELADSTDELTEINGVGWQTQEQWQALADMLKTYDALPNVDVSSVFTTKILEMAKTLP